MIFAFSSDARREYLADIFRAVSLPDGAVMHFRYKAKYVDPNIIKNRASYVRQDLIVFLTTGNAPDLPPEQRNPQHLPIRLARITALDYSPKTELIHIYFELRDFVNIEFDETLLIAGKFLQSYDAPTKIHDISWATLIPKLSPTFDGHTFFHIESIVQSSRKKVGINIENDGKSYLCGIHKDDRVFINYHIASAKSTDARISFTNESDSFRLEPAESIVTDLEFDDGTANLITKDTSKKIDFGRIRFTSTKKSPHNPPEEFSVDLPFSIRQKFARSLSFGAAIAASSVGFWWARNIQISEGICCDWQGILGLLMLFLGSTFLLHYYNKK